jgi:hypothetical protein
MVWSTTGTWPAYADAMVESSGKTRIGWMFIQALMMLGREVA